MKINIKREFLSGVKWNAVGQFGTQIILFFVSVFLARILLPEEFGLIGMASVFIGISSVFINSGLGAALIKKQDCTSKDYSTVFIYNFVLSLFFYFAIFYSAGNISIFFNEPDLVLITKLASLNFLINGIGMVHSTILQKELKFKVLNLISIISVVVSSVVALLLAFNNFGVLSLVWQQIVFASVSNILYWYYSNWRPKLVWSSQSFRELFGFGSKLLISSVIDKIYTSMDNLIIGKVFSAAQLGYFTRAKSTRDLPVNNTAGILTNIIFPIFSKIQCNEELKNYQFKILSIISYLIFPTMAAMVVLAKPLVIILFTAKWLPSVWMLQALCVIGPIFPLSVVMVQTILAKGRSDVFLKLEIVKKIVGFSSLLPGIFWGIEVFILGVVLGNIISFILNVFYTGKVISARPKYYIFVFLPPFLLSLIMAIAMFILKFLSFENIYYLFALQIITGLLVYIGLSKIFRVKEFIYLCNLFKEYFQNLKHRESG